MNKTLEELKCIKVVHTYEGESTTDWLSFNQYYNSFVIERWSGERRTQKKDSIFGCWHSKTTVTNPYNKSKSIRLFTFPANEEEARELDKQYR